ncbi:MAG TPA: FtsX-like permease family protein, partial [Puia sp.]|nr:FtsX-like permease family protein [Puia sp.]
QPLLAIHRGNIPIFLESSNISNPAYSYILGGIASFILLIACINFINLTIARSIKRSKEVGIRKIIGGSRFKLVTQFLTESFLACSIAFLLAIGLALLALPVFNDVMNKQLSLSYLLDVRLILESIGFLLVTGLAAGFYPAMVLSGFNPLDTLYQRLRVTGGAILAKALVVVQFALAGIFIICAFFISRQVHFLAHKDLGYNDADLVTVNIDADNGQRFARLFRNELLRNPAILAVARHNGQGRMEIAQAEGKQILFSYEHIDENYFRTLQIPLVMGRNFSPEFPADSLHSIIVNETFAQNAGWKNPIGRTIEFPANHQRMTIVGVVRDFNYWPLTMNIMPQLFSIEPAGDDLEFDIRIAPADKAETLAFIQKVFSTLAPYYPFSYTFRQDDNRHAYDAQEKWQAIITFAAIFTAFLSCIGLFGLTLLATERRIKEIGIRKVLGASVAQLVRLLSLGFIALVILANFIAIPLAWWAMDKWLQNFAYRISLQWWVFALALLMSVLLAFATMALRAVKAATASPATNLRAE